MKLIPNGATLLESVRSHCSVKCCEWVMSIKHVISTLNCPMSYRPLLYPFAEGHRQHLSARHRCSVVTRVLRKSLDDPATCKKPYWSSDGCHSLCRPAEPFQSKFFARLPQVHHCIASLKTYSEHNYYRLLSSPVGRWFSAVLEDAAQRTGRAFPPHS